LRAAPGRGAASGSAEALLETAMSNRAKKVVLVSKTGYHPRHDDLLRSFINRKIVLFCAVGKDCRKWEAVMDELCFAPDGTEIHFVTTASHPDEPVENVIHFAEFWSEGGEDVDVIEI
jgi:hypothetical protein